MSLKQSKGSKPRKGYAVKGIVPKCRSWVGKTGLMGNTRAVLKENLRKQLKEE